MRKYRVLAGVNVQWPWSQLIASGDKTIETRSYPLPAKYVGQDLALIETPGPRGKKEAGIEQARIIAIVRFSGSFQYATPEQWARDYGLHRVPVDDVQFRFVSAKPKWGWTVERVEILEKTAMPPKRRGIVFATSCRVPVTDQALS